MNRFRLALLAFSLLAFVVAASDGILLSEGQAAPGDRVVIYAQNASSSRARIWMDGVYHGEVPGKDYVTVPTTIGEHTFSFRRGGLSTSIRINVTRNFQTIRF